MQHVILDFVHKLEILVKKKSIRMLGSIEFIIERFWVKLACLHLYFESAKTAVLI